MPKLKVPKLTVPKLTAPKLAIPQLPEELRTTTRVAVQMNQAVAQAFVSTSYHYITRTLRAPNSSLSYEGMVEFLARSLPAREVPVAELRAAMDLVARLPVLHPARVEAVQMGGVPALRVGDAAHEQRVILYLHGGGYCTGSSRIYLGLINEFAHAAQARVLAPDYHLAPEAPFPAALEDAWAVFWALLAEGADPRNVVLMGDSAGGGLALALLLSLRDAGLPLPAAAVCLSPWLDLGMGGRSLRANSARDYLNEPIMRAAISFYAGEYDPRAPLVSPLYADLRGLPPLLIQVGTTEMLLDDSTRFARRAVEAGVAIELELWENMVHDWHFFYPFELQARLAIRRAGLFVRAHTETAAAGGSED